MTWEVTDRRYNTIIDGVGADPLNSPVVVSLDQENAVYSCKVPASTAHVCPWANSCPRFCWSST